MKEHKLSPRTESLAFPQRPVPTIIIVRAMPMRIICCLKKNNVFSFLLSDHNNTRNFKRKHNVCNAFDIKRRSIVLLTNICRHFDFVLSEKIPVPETQEITTVEAIINEAKVWRMWLKDNPSNVRALHKTVLIISWLKTLSYFSAKPSMKNPTENN